MHRLLPLAALALGTAACTVTEPRREVILPIDRLTAPVSVSRDSVLRITVSALGGGCRSLDRFEVIRTPGVLSVTAVGIDVSRPDLLCTADLRRYDATYDVAPPFGARVTVRAQQPDGSVLAKVVEVR